VGGGGVTAVRVITVDADLMLPWLENRTTARHLPAAAVAGDFQRYVKYPLAYRAMADFTTTLPAGSVIVTHARPEEPVTTRLEIVALARTVLT